MSEQTFVRELERRADDVQPRHLRFEDVRASAYRIRRRRRVAVAGGVAAVVAAAILVPTALLGGSPKSTGPEPVPPGPTITPGQTVPYDLDAPQGDAPRVLYQHVADSVAIDSDGEHDLPSGTSQVVPYGDGFLALADGENPTPVQLRLYRLDADYEVVEDLGPVGSAIRASADGRRAAWMEVAPNEAFLVVAEDGEVVQRLPLPEGNIGYPVGFTATGTVYNIEKLDGGGTWRWEVAVGDERTPVPHLGYVWDASPVSDLVVGDTRFDRKKNLPCAGAVAGSELLWERCWLPARGPQPRRLAGHRLPRRGHPVVPAAHRARRAHRPEGGRVRRRASGHRRRGGVGGRRARARGRPAGRPSGDPPARAGRHRGADDRLRAGRARSASPGSWPADPSSDTLVCPLTHPGTRRVGPVRRAQPSSETGADSTHCSVAGGAGGTGHGAPRRCPSPRRARGDRLAAVGRQVQGGRRTSAGDHLRAERGDHGAVVGAQPGPRHPHAYADARSPLLGHRAQPRVGGDPAADEQVVDARRRSRRRAPCGSARRRPPPGTTPRRRRPGPARRCAREPRPSGRPRS